MIAVLGLPSLFNNKADYIEATFAVDMVFEDDLIEPKKTAEEEIKTKVTLKKIEKKIYEHDVDQAKPKNIKPILRSKEPEKITRPEPIKYKKLEKLSIPKPDAIKQMPKPQSVKQNEHKVASIPKPSLVKPPTEKKLSALKKNVKKRKPYLKPDQTQSNFKSLLKSVVQEEPKKVSKSEFVDLVSDIVETLPVTEERVVNSKEIVASNPGMSSVRANRIVALITLSVQNNWSVPAGIRDAGDLIINLHIQFEPDGNVRDVTILDSLDGAKPNFVTMAESAQRAVLKASPILALREYVDDYNEWRNVKMRFKPPV